MECDTTFTSQERCEYVQKRIAKQAKLQNIIHLAHFGSIRRIADKSDIRDATLNKVSCLHVHAGIVEHSEIESTRIIKNVHSILQELWMSTNTSIHFFVSDYHICIYLLFLFLQFSRQPVGCIKLAPWLSSAAGAIRWPKLRRHNQGQRLQLTCAEDITRPEGCHGIMLKWFKMYYQKVGTLFYMAIFQLVGSEKADWWKKLIWIHTESFNL